jgi:hypothetical protein
MLLPRLPMLVYRRYLNTLLTDDFQKHFLARSVDNLQSLLKR